jgi:hypothetical protein
MPKIFAVSSLSPIADIALPKLEYLLIEKTKINTKVVVIKLNN